MKGVIIKVEATGMREHLTLHEDRLGLTSPRLIDELTTEPFLTFEVAFRSLSNISLLELFGDVLVESPSFPTAMHAATRTPLHDRRATPGSLDFFDQPRANGKRSGRRITDPDSPYRFMARKEIAAPGYSGTRHNEIRR